MTTTDPMDDAIARIRAAGDQWGAAVGDAIKVAIRRTVVAQLAEDLGPGPWLLHPDARVERYAEPGPEQPAPE